MNKNGIRTQTAAATRQILWSVQNQQSISVLIDATSVTADEKGKRIIPAGTALGGPDNVLMERGASVVPITNPADAAQVQGLLLHDVDATGDVGDSNGTMLIWGFVNVDRIDEDAVPDPAIQTALKGKITFLAD